MELYLSLPQVSLFCRYAFFHLFIVRLIWIYQHLQCCTRERSMQWTEGPTHAMRRQHLLITQYKTSLQQQSGHRNPSIIWITALSDSAALKGIRWPLISPFYYIRLDHLSGVKHVRC